MDRYHDRFSVYDDVGSAGNHFLKFAKIPDANAPVSVNGSWASNPHTGATAIRCEFTGPGFGGIYFQNGLLLSGATSPIVNFGTVPNSGVDLSGAESLTFWARGEVGGEKIEFFLGGVGRDASTGDPTELFPGSSPRHPAIGTRFTLTTQWQQFIIDVSGLDLSYTLGGFGWLADDANNPLGAVFYVDDIQYNLTTASRLNQPRFLRSFETLPVQPDPFDANTLDDIDLVLRNLAFSYDNSLALLAFLADGSVDSIRRARLIGDAFVYAANNDRFFSDGRIRTAYAAGDIALPPGWTPNGVSGTVPIPGFFSETLQQSFEVGQEASDVGNNAWTMIALLALYQETADSSYLDTARNIGEFIKTMRNNVGTYQGFQGGVDDPEGVAPIKRVFASAEHNIDVYAAFQTMFSITGELDWKNGATHSQTFVESTYDSGQMCFLAGSYDPETLNTLGGQLPVDVQAWSILGKIPLALSNSLAVLGCAESNHRTHMDGFSGFDFNEDKDGVWFEGTGHMSTAYQQEGQVELAERLRAELRRAQQTSPFGNALGLSAASRDGLTTGFGFKFFRRLHIAATAWHVFAQSHFNPYYQEVLP